MLGNFYPKTKGSTCTKTSLIYEVLVDNVLWVEERNELLIMGYSSLSSTFDRSVNDKTKPIHSIIDFCRTVIPNVYFEIIDWTGALVRCYSQHS